MKVVDMHCDTISILTKDNSLNLRKNNLMIDLEKMRKGDYLVQCFAMFVNLKKINVSPYQYVNLMIDKFKEQMELNKDVIKQVYSYDDIIKNNEVGLMSALLTIEEGETIEGDLDKLRTLYQKGVRMITLTWNYPNQVAFPNVTYNEDGSPNFKDPNTTKGLTNFGIKMIKEMEKLGIIIDVSHLGDKGFYDVYENTTKPFVASHSNARSVCSNIRNMTDDMILKLASRKGVMGINYCSYFVNNDKNGDNYYTGVNDLVKHIKYIKELAGIDCIGLGSDFDGISPTLEMKDASMLNMLALKLKEAGFSDCEIEKIFYKNVLRVFKEVLHA